MNSADGNVWESASCQDLFTEAIQYFRKNNKYKLLPKIFSKIKDLSKDKQFRDIVFCHIKILQDILPKLNQAEHFYDLKFASAEECLAFHISKFFLEKISLYPTTVPRSLPFLEDFEEPVESIPIEAFLRPNKAVQNSFIKTLKKTDLIYAEVTDSDLNKNDDDYTELKVIAKFEPNSCLVYNLDIYAYMFRKTEINRLGIDAFKTFEVLKVSVLGIYVRQDVEKIFVTTNNSIIRIENAPTLGIISPQDLPFNPNLKLFKTAKTCLSYANYLRTHSNFSHTHIKEIVKSVGIDPYKIYSFSEKRDGYSPETSECCKALLEKATTVESIERKKSQSYLDEAKISIEKKDILKALSSFDEALKFWPKNFQVFEMRGKMYFDMANKGDSEHLRKATLDFETALKLNPSSMLSKTCFESILIRLAKREIKKKNYSEVKLYLIKAQKLNKNNLVTEVLMKRLETKLKQNRQKEEKELRQLIRLEKAKELIVQRLKTES